MNICNSFNYYYKENNIDPIGQNGCWVWLDASDNSTFTTTANRVDEWRDKSITKYIFTNATATTTRPTYTVNSLNTRPTVAFARASFQYLVSNKNIFSVGTNSFHIFIVFKLTSTSTSVFQGIFNKSYYGGQLGRIYLYKGFVSGTSVGNMVFDIQQNQAYSGGEFAMNDTTYNLFALLCTRTSASCSTTIRKNGTALSFSTSTGSTGVTVDNLSNDNFIFLGAYNPDNSTSSNLPLSTATNNSYLDGNIAEIIGYSTGIPMSDANIQKAEGYLAWKWGLQGNLPSEHTFKNSAPVL